MFNDILSKIKNKLFGAESPAAPDTPQTYPQKFAELKAMGKLPIIQAKSREEYELGKQQMNEGAIILGTQTPPEPTQITTGRNPNWETWQKQSPKSFEELLSGARLASESTGVPADLLMDISGAETSGGQFLNQFGGAPGQGYFQFEPATLQGLGSDIDPYSATESAQLAAELIKNGKLSRWGTPQDGGRNWGTLDNPNNSNGSLVDLYSPEELNPYLAPEYQIR